MIDTADLECVSPYSAPPGSLLVHVAKVPNHSAMLMIGGGGPRNALTIDNGPRGFRIINGHGGHDPFALLSRPCFLVDPSSALNGVDSSPEPGTLFPGPKGYGIVATADHVEMAVMLDGELVADVDWAAFAGFRHWRIEIGDPLTPHVLFTYRHASLDENTPASG